jgi:hypothetical protein
VRGGEDPGPGGTVAMVEREGKGHSLPVTVALVEAVASTAETR